MNGDRLTPEEAKTEVVSCTIFGELIPSPHFKEELVEENVSFGDTTSLLSGNGRIFEQAEWDEVHREWKYRIEGYETDGKWLVVIFSLPSKLTAKLITVFSRKPRTIKRKGP